MFDRQMGSICACFKARRNEPALVSEFAIEEDFRRSDKFQYDGEADVDDIYKYAKSQGKADNTRILHSMVLLGFWEDQKSGKVWFFLQNFRANKYLVVVSGEYLASCSALITFAPLNESVSLKSQMEMVDAHYCETETSPEEEEQACPEEMGM